MSFSICLTGLSRWLALAVTAAAIAGCAQMPSKSELTPVRQHTAFVPIKKRNHLVETNQREPRSAAIGMASYYVEGSRTASGEKLNPNALTAAHPSLPFGTRLRVTNLSSGRSVVVRVNDRGPFVKGRIVDVSYLAAEQLGLTRRGVAKVKIDILQQPAQ